LLEKLCGLTGLLHASSSTLNQIGIGRAKRAKLLASVEIARRMTAGKLPGHPLERPDAVARHVRMHYELRDQEVMGVLYLNSRNQLMGEEELFRGSISRLVVEPRQILRNALERGASGVIIFHTHPSGDPSPSSEDMLFTRRVREAGEILGIVLVDHLIVGSSGGWTSMKQRGAW
jgi:DNA repair protein RadC